MSFPKCHLLMAFVFIVCLLVNGTVAPRSHNSNKNKTKQTAEVGVQNAATLVNVANPSQNEQQQLNSAPLRGKETAADEGPENDGKTALMKEMHDTLARMEQNQHKQQQTIEELRGQVAQLGREIHARVDEGQYAMAKTVSAIDLKMKAYQNDMQRSIDQLIFNGLTVGNQWDANACERGLEITGPEQLVVQHSGLSMHAFCSVCAKFPIPKKGIFYFEVKDRNEFPSFAAIGLATKQMPLDDYVAYYDGKNTKLLNYHSYEIYTHMSLFGSSSSTFPIYKDLPSFNPGDVVGCGVNLATRRIFYTKNGKRIGTPTLFPAADSAHADVFPCVTLLWTASQIEANFGPTFMYNIDIEK